MPLVKFGSFPEKFRLITVRKMASINNEMPKQFPDWILNKTS